MYAPSIQEYEIAPLRIKQLDNVINKCNERIEELVKELEMRQHDLNNWIRRRNGFQNTIDMFEEQHKDIIDDIRRDIYDTRG